MRTALENKTHSAGITLRCRVNDFCSPSYQLVLETESVVRLAYRAKTILARTYRPWRGPNPSKRAQVKEIGTRLKETRTRVHHLYRPAASSGHRGLEGN